MRRALVVSFALVLCLASLLVVGQATVAAAGQAKPALVNLNTADQAALEALPGVGPATAKKIVAGRPYASIADLAKAGVPKNTIEKITPLLTVGSASATGVHQRRPGRRRLRRRARGRRRQQRGRPQRRSSRRSRGWCG